MTPAATTAPAAATTTPSHLLRLVDRPQPVDDKVDGDLHGLRGAESRPQVLVVPVGVQQPVQRARHLEGLLLKIFVYLPLQPLLARSLDKSWSGIYVHYCTVTSGYNIFFLFTF